MSTTPSEISMYCAWRSARLYDRLKKALELQTGPTSHSIGLDTLNMAIVMVQSLEIYKGMSRMVSDTVYMLLVVSGFHS